MKPGVILAVSAFLTAGSMAFAQNAVEYGKLPIIPPKLPSATSALASRIGNEKGTSKNANVTNVTTKNTTSEMAAQEGSTGEEAQTAPAPSAGAVFILSNGERLESSDYMLTFDSLRLVQNGVQRTIPMSAVNVEATLAANKERGINLKIPRNKSQVVLSF
jgi:hypothetical protein